MSEEIDDFTPPPAHRQTRRACTKGADVDRCICCQKDRVTWPRVCENCQDKEAQAELADAGYDTRCRSCGMIYDGGTRCTYCGDIDPADTGEFEEEQRSGPFGW